MMGLGHCADFPLSQGTRDLQKPPSLRMGQPPPPVLYLLVLQMNLTQPRVQSLAAGMVDIQNKAFGLLF